MHRNATTRNALPKPNPRKTGWIDAEILFTGKKRKMYVSCVAHFDTWLKHALAHYMLKTTPFALLLNAPLDPYSIKRSLKKGDRMHLSKFNMI